MFCNVALKVVTARFTTLAQGVAELTYSFSLVLGCGDESQGANRTLECVHGLLVFLGQTLSFGTSFVRILTKLSSRLSQPSAYPLTIIG